MAESKKSEDNGDSCLDLLDILRDKRRIRLGNPQSGEYIIIEYNLTNEYLKPQLTIEAPSKHPSDSLHDSAQPLSQLNSQLPSPISDASQSQSIPIDALEKGDLEPNQPNLQTPSAIDALSKHPSDSLHDLDQFSNRSNRPYVSHSKRYTINEGSISDFLSIHFNTVDQITNILSSSRLNIPYEHQIKKIIKPTVDKTIEALIAYCKTNKRLKELVDMIEQESGDSIARNDERLDKHFGSRPPKVFISYSHDSDEHREIVLQLSDLLWEDGIECEIDQFYENNPPPEGWNSWTETQVVTADFVLVVFTEKYRQRYDRKEPGKGRGVAWEGAIIDAIMYDDYGTNKKFIPVVFSEEDLKYIPYKLKSTSHYIIKNEPKYKPEYDKLFRRLTDQGFVKKPPRGTIRQLPSREPSPWKFKLD